MKLVVALGLVILLGASAKKATEEDFEEFQTVFKKKYKNKEEKEERKKIFLQNEDEVNQKHEDFLSGKSHWDASMHDFDDLTPEEVEQKFGVHDLPHLSSSRSFQSRSSITPSSIASRNIPDQWSWVEQGGVSPVKSQVCFIQFYALFHCIYLG